MTNSDLRLLSYARDDGAPRAGLLVDGCVLDAGLALGVGRGVSISMLDLLDEWPRVQALLTEFAAAGAGNTRGTPLSEVRLFAPVLYPGTVYCAGANYRDHLLEMARANNTAPDADPRTRGDGPWHFVRPSRSCIVGPGATVRRPPRALKLDWEAELAAVIGIAARNVSPEDALAHVAGFTIANDLSARDLSRRQTLPPGSPFRFDWVAHKGFEGACPLGPWITPSSQVPDPQALGIRLWVNGTLMQDSSTAEMIFTVAEQIAYLSRSLTLYPGDVVLTGTPAGVGAARDVFLQPGDRVRIEIDGLGSLDTYIA